MKKVGLLLIFAGILLVAFLTSFNLNLAPRQSTSANPPLLQSPYGPAGCGFYGVVESTPQGGSLSQPIIPPNPVVIYLGTSTGALTDGLNTDDPSIGGGNLNLGVMCGGDCPTGQVCGIFNDDPSGRGSGACMCIDKVIYDYIGAAQSGILTTSEPPCGNRAQTGVMCGGWCPGSELCVPNPSIPGSNCVCTS
jgi:hypothetical protein